MQLNQRVININHPIELNGLSHSINAVEPFGKRKKGRLTEE